MRKWLVTFGILVLAVGGFAFWFLSHTEPKQLDMADNLFPGESNAKMLVKDQVFDKDLGLKLNIWVPAEASGKPSRTKGPVLDDMIAFFERQQ